MSNESSLTDGGVGVLEVECHPDIDQNVSGRFVLPWTGAGIRSFLESRAGTHCEYYGHGKTALRDGLDLLSSIATDEKSNVVLPAYIPSGLLEPIKEAGYSPRFYRITKSLRTDLGDVEAQIDTDTLALLSVNYFGFPQPDHDALVGLAADYGIPLIEDNAHSALSMTPEGTILGTRGDIGFTSFRKTLPVPDGSILYVWRDDIVDGPYPRSGIYRRVNVRDARMLLRYVHDVVGPNNSGSPPAWSDASWTDGRDLFGRDPHKVYQASKGQMSLPSALLLESLRPESIIQARREKYRDRQRLFEDIEGVRPVFDTLGRGVCPHSYPVLIEEWDEFSTRQLPPHVTVSRWPPLPHEVGTDSRFETVHYLATHLVPIPL